mgnify:CR=1 FL=1
MIVGLLAVVACLNYLDRYILTTMRGSIVGAIPMTDAQFGLLTSMFLWVYAFMSPVGGFIADRLGRTKVIISSLFLWSGVTWLTAHATTFPELLATRVVMGLSEACYLPAALALISDYHRGPTRSLATGIHMIGLSFGQGLGGLGGVLAERHGWSYPFMLFGGIGIECRCEPTLRSSQVAEQELGRLYADPSCQWHSGRGVVGHQLPQVRCEAGGFPRMGLGRLGAAEGATGALGIPRFVDWEEGR